MQTARFSSVVQSAGTPEPYLTWAAPDRDATLRKLVRQGRVVTVHQEWRGAKKDYGTVGLHQEGAAQLLVFPRSVRQFANRKIVGIDYAKLAGHSHGAGAAIKLKRPTAPPDKPARLSSVAGLPKPVAASARVASTGFPPADRPLSPKSRPSPAPERDVLLRAVRRAVADLRAGRAVKAYEALRALVGG